MPNTSHATPASGLPPVKFARPPVIETLLGVQFAPMPKFSLLEVGLFWVSIRDRYPGHEVKPPLVPQVEMFPPVARPTAPELQIALEPEVRFWFIDVSGTELIQLQHDRFIRNWRKTETDSGYPSYDELRPRFERDWLSFIRFLGQEGLGEPRINQCEITYINHIEVGSHLRSLGDLSLALKVLSSHPAESFLPAPEMTTLHLRYVMPDKRGRLHVAAQPAVRRSDSKEVLQLTLTARGEPRSSDTDQLLSWFDEGHEWIVQGFASITTDVMQHEVWRRL